jgi:hypothetical protein
MIRTGIKAAMNNPIGNTCIANNRCSERENRPNGPNPIGMKEPISHETAIADPTSGSDTRMSLVSS